MPPRRTTTRTVLENMIIPALIHGGYNYQKQVNIGKRLGGSRHIIDVLATKENNKKILISLKWQQVPGTAEQKVPFEAMCLADAKLSSQGEFNKAYLVLGGEGWSLRDFFIGGGALWEYTPPNQMTLARVRKIEEENLETTTVWIFPEGRLEAEVRHVCCGEFQG